MNRPPEITLKDWYGKRRWDLIQQFGQPTSATPVLETGGEAMVYAKPGQPQYYFEIGPEGTIVKAIETK